MKFSLILNLLSVFILSEATTVPNADTPLFYLVSSSNSSSNLLSLRMNTGGGGSASLVGSGVPAQLYFSQGRLTVYDPNSNAFSYRPLINTLPGPNGCQTFGALTFVQGSSTNKCGSFNTFQIQSNGQDSQLGSQLVFNFVGGFYACNGGEEVFYKVNETDGPAHCDSTHLYTVPV